MLLTSLLLIILALRYFLFFRSVPTFNDGQNVSLEETIRTESRVVGNTQAFALHLEGGEKLFVTTHRFPEIHYGDRLRLSGTLRKKLLNNKKVILTMYFPKFAVVENEKRGVLAVISPIRQNLIALFQKTLPPVSASLLLGIVFGIDAGMPQDFVKAIRATGVAHVIAASGMNVTMVAGFLAMFFGFFLKRQLALILSILGICFYALLAGAEPSILRASIMGALSFTAQMLGRQTLALYSLFLAGYTMLFASPQLLFDVGFQLSFFATLGLVLLRPLFNRREWIRMILTRSVIGEEIATTISAQIATMPILLANFGNYSLWSILVNGLVLWTIPTLMVLGGLGAVLGMLFEPLGKLSLYLSYPFLIYFREVVVRFAKMGAVAAVADFPWQLGVGYYLVLGAVLILLRKQR